MSEETIIGPGAPCYYCGEEYGEHRPLCPTIIQTRNTPGITVSTDSQLLHEMEGILAHAKAQHCHEVTIELIEQAIMHQRISEDITAIEKEKDDSQRDSPQKPNP